MKDMNEIVSQKIDYLHSEIKEMNAQLNKAVEDFRRYVSNADAYDIVTFVPGKIREIEWQRKRIEALEEQARMLVWMAKEADDKETTYRIKKTCYDFRIGVPPYDELVDTVFSKRSDAEEALFEIVDDEVDELNSGDAEGEFYGRFDNAVHDAVTEFWEGPPTENDRSFRVVTEYDIVETKEGKAR